MTAAAHTTNEQYTFTNIEVRQFAASARPETARRVSLHEGRPRASITSVETPVLPLAFHYRLPCAKDLHQNSEVTGHHMFCGTRMAWRCIKGPRVLQNGPLSFTRLPTKLQ
ncbi:hypothetical protein TRVL_10100 [Trypanosoma vivax]|nr:hypothetical protein TRVL_10100 [Trypanosoma vivax]